jgi:hypothetical protein
MESNFDSSLVKSFLRTTQNTLHVMKIGTLISVFRVPNIVTVFSDSVLSKYYMKKIVIQHCHIQTRHSELSVRLRGRFGAKKQAFLFFCDLQSTAKCFVTAFQK